MTVARCDPQSGFVQYLGFPSKLHHEVPLWVKDGALYHIRIRLDVSKPQSALTDEMLASRLLESARLYETQQIWYITLFLLMPDHGHALLSFCRVRSMSRIIGDWKHFHKRKHKIEWQEGFFDHRIRDDKRGVQIATKMEYIRQNPVVAGLCAKAEDWPWKLDPDQTLTRH